MATDYILFVHGVNTRDPENLRWRADRLFERLAQRLPAQSGPEQRQVKAIIPYWGNVGQESLQELRQNLPLSPQWKSLWLRQQRLGTALDFIGDGALYLSRHVGFKVVQVMLAKVMQEIQPVQPGDRLHLITHSWGSVILFDILFAKRWESPNLPENMRRTVAQIRNALLGLGDNPGSGIPVASIYTMGSPIALFNLVNQEGSGHNLTQELGELLRSLYRQQGCALDWVNILHPGDLIAYPLEGLVETIAQGGAQGGAQEGTQGGRKRDARGSSSELEDTLNLQDRIIRTRRWWDRLVGMLQWVPMLNGVLTLSTLGSAHDSYWHNEAVVEAIAQTIHQSRCDRAQGKVASRV
jgi:hypothetical protein